MTPEEIQRVKDLLPTTLGSEGIRGTIAAGSAMHGSCLRLQRDAEMTRRGM